MASAQEIGIAVATALSSALKPLIDTVAQQKATPSAMVDTRGIGRPPSFDGAERSWREWKGKVMAYLYATAPNSKSVLEWADSCASPIVMAMLEAQCTDAQGVLNQTNLDDMCHFSTRLFLILVDTCKGEPYRIVESAGHGNGLEAWRLLMRRYASRTPGTKRALLASLFAMKPATSAVDFESVLLTVEEIIRRYDAMSASKMPEDIQCAILIAVCPKDLKEFLDMSTDDFKYLDLRTRATNWIERKRDAHGKQLGDMERRQSSGHAPMDISWFGEWSSRNEWHEPELQGVQDWGGHSSQWSFESQDLDDSSTWPDVHFMHKGSKGKSKGKGKLGKGPASGKGKSAQKGLPFSTKGSSKGTAKGGGQFQGECHYCGRWGHPARECKLKDAHMAQRRQASSVEESTPEQSHVDEEGQNHLSGLESVSARRSLGPWELSGVIAQHDCGHDSLRRSSTARIDCNRFAALCLEDDEHDAQSVGRFGSPQDEAPSITSSASIADYPWAVKVSQGTRKKWKRNLKLLSPICEDCEVSSVGVHSPSLGERVRSYTSDDVCDESRRVVLTIDSGAAEHVVGPRDLPHIQITSPRKNVRYTMANGHRTSNHGEQSVSAITLHGQEISFKAQVTDVHRPLMSVSRICDRGNRVVFEAQGGYIESLTTGEKIQVKRDQNVYRLQVDVPGQSFQGQGRNGGNP